MNKEILWLWFAYKESLTKKQKFDLYKKFEDIESLYNAKESDYDELKFINSSHIKELMDKDLSKYEKLSLLYLRNNVKILTYDMLEYPQNLKHLSCPPLLLYCRGKFIDLNKRLCISVVGTRKVTDYGINCTKNITREIAQRGALIVSGMANGVDSYAHREAILSGMPTVAVVGTGVNMVYPKTNSRLMKDIMKSGMVISEYPLNTEAQKFHFPERNRIISALSVATVVIEADIKSGSLITANYSQELGKDVFAVPGSIYSVYSKGTNYLIKDGAYVATCGEDVISPYEYKYNELILNGLNDRIKVEADTKDYQKEKNKKEIKTEKTHINNVESDEEKIILSLKNGSLNIDEICEMTSISISVLNQKLLLMELSGKLKKLPGNNYSLNNI